MNIKINWFTIALITLLTITSFLLVREGEKNKVTTELLKASTDTLHSYKTKLGNLGAYKSTLVGDKDQLIQVLTGKSKQDSVIIDSLKKDHKIQSISVVNTNSNSDYSHKVDTVYKGIRFKDSISTKWYDASIKVDSGTSKWNIKTRDEIDLTTTLKSNGFLKGSTLTTYATSANKDESVTGLTSVNTVINKPRLIIAPAIGVGLNSDMQGKNVRFGFSAGVVITIK